MQRSLSFSSQTTDLQAEDLDLAPEWSVYSELQNLTHCHIWRGMKQSLYKHVFSHIYLFIQQHFFVKQQIFF